MVATVASIQEVRREDYRPPDYDIVATVLDFHLDADNTEVCAELQLRCRQPQAPKDLTLQGESLDLLELRIDGQRVSRDRYEIVAEGLRLRYPPQAFTLSSRVRICPAANTQLSGLYAADGVLLTQCEAEGFRRITYYLDRPDCLAPFTVTLHAARERYPILLANGNLEATGADGSGGHWARWRDPFPKPSYLFALVAGNFVVERDDFTTMSGRSVRLELYVAERYRDSCRQALDSLKRAMAWDERVYGREYDLERYMIVATDSFNMGAMENKGLNIFNSKYVLASPETATDDDYLHVESVIAHEYFHNWTGNRVTLRDWFQLSLKEGLTVFRDQEFSADQNSRGVQRIADVRRLRTTQFPEDAGPLAHPVRPDAYAEINNFYTATVYEKGAEIVRMIHTTLGPARFRAGMDTYFARFDGQAVTIEDFLAALEAGSGCDLQAFRRWYAQAGTPRVQIHWRQDPRSASLHLRLSQWTPPTPGQPHKWPVPIPVRLALLDSGGKRLPLHMGDRDLGEETVLLLTEAEQEWTFTGVTEPCVPSLFRGFSAPVIVQRSDAASAEPFLARYDDDPFSRWENFQALAIRELLGHIADPGRVLPGIELRDAVAAVTARWPDDPAFCAELLSLPSEEYLGEQMEVLQVDAIHAARESLRKALAEIFGETWMAWYRGLAAPYRLDGLAVGQRRLRQLALYYLLANESVRWEAIALARLQYAEADNMSERLAAYTLLVQDIAHDSEDLIVDFHRTWRHHPLVLDRWFSIQLGRAEPATLHRAANLLVHPDFDWHVPNRVRSVLGAFAANPTVFHAADGSGYRFFGEQIRRLDDINPQTAARLATVLSRWPRLDEGRRSHMQEVIAELARKPDLSRDLAEVLSRCQNATAESPGNSSGKHSFQLDSSGALAMDINVDTAVEKGLGKGGERCLDAASLAVAELLAGRDMTDLDAAAAAFGSDQVGELAGFLFESMDCKALQDCCAAEQFDPEQAREWGLNREQYRLAHTIALVARKIERQREKLPPC